LKAGFGATKVRPYRKGDRLALEVWFCQSEQAEVFKKHILHNKICREENVGCYRLDGMQVLVFLN
jgi:hypothetical protein